MKYGLQALGGDVLAGFTTAVVVLPIALGFGVASGLGAEAGLYSAIAMGFFASVFGGTPRQISGPTAPMTVAMAAIVTSHAETLSEALTVVVIAGFIQVLLGVSRIGRFIVYTPFVVVSGFMSGIGLIVICTQLLPALGLSPVSGGAVGAVLALPDAFAKWNADSLLLAVITLGIAIFWPRQLHRFAPAPLAALVIGTLAGIYLFKGAPAIGSVPMGLPGIRVGMPDLNFVLGAVEPALILALLGAVESLLTSLVVDQTTGGNHNPNKELVGQGLGNIVTGMFGGVAGCASAPLTLTNLRAGARTGASGVIFAVLVTGVLVGAGQLLEPVPLAVLAGILIKVGWDVIDRRLLSLVHRIRREHMVVMLTTLLMTVLLDLVTAIAIGLIVAGMAQSWQLESLELDSVVSVPVLDSKFFAGREAVLLDDPLAARVGMVALRGRFTVASSKKLTETIGKDIDEHEIVILDFSQATHLDDSAAMVVDQLIDRAAKANTPCIVMGLHGNVLHTLSTLNVLSRLAQAHVVETLDEARDLAETLLIADRPQ